MSASQSQRTTAASTRHVQSAGFKQAKVAVTNAVQRLESQGPPAVYNPNDDVRANGDTDDQGHVTVLMSTIASTTSGNTASASPTASAIPTAGYTASSPSVSSDDDSSDDEITTL